MAGCYDRESRVGSKSRGTRTQFRLNTHSLSPFKCTHPLYLTDVMDTGQSSQTAQVRSGGIVSPIRTGRTVREYDQEIEELRKENFDLKLRIFLVEQKNGKALDHGPSSPIAVDVQLKVETEALQQELSYKNKLLQDALEQAEKYEVDLKEALLKNTQFQEQIDALSEESRCKIEELTKEKDSFRKKAEISTSTIQGLVQKIQNDIDDLPEKLRLLAVEAVVAARNKNQENVVSTVNDIKSFLCQLMCKPYGDVFQTIPSHPSQVASNEQIQCLQKELAKEKDRCKRLELLVMESKKQIQELKQTLSEKEAALKNHFVDCDTQEHRTKDRTINDIQKQLTEKTTALEFLKKLLIFPTQSSETEESLEPSIKGQESKYVKTNATVKDLENHVNYLRNIDSIIEENHDIFDSNENLSHMANQIADIVRSKNQLMFEFDDKLKEIDNLTVTCSELEKRIIQLQNELHASRLLVKELESKSKEDKVKHTNLQRKSNALTQTIERDVQTISDLSLTDFKHSNNINKLNEEICMLTLTIEQKDKQLQDLIQDNAFLKAKLDEACHQIEMSSSQLSDIHGQDVANLHEQLARTQFVNLELMKQLQNLEAFMENLIQYRNADSSSLDISDVPDSFSKLSGCLNKIRVLSSTLSEHLSICEGSRVFYLEDPSMTGNDTIESQIAIEEHSYSHLDPASQTQSTENIDEGRSIPMNNGSDFNQYSVRTGKRRRWSFSPQEHEMDTTLINADDVAILTISDNEHTELHVTENDLPQNVRMGNNEYKFNDIAVNSSLLNPALNSLNSQPRRRCWGDDSSLNFFMKEKSPIQPKQNMTILNSSNKNANLNVTWYNPCPSSDSDIWSEPDRDVSMQRIGIDVKQSPVQLKSPSHKSRFNRSRQTTDEISTEKSSFPYGCVKAQSWSRRRRSSGSAVKQRLFPKKDYKLDKHLALLIEESPRFASLLSQFDNIKEVDSDKAEVLADVFEVLSKLKSSICETKEELIVLKDKAKNGYPMSCEKCIVNELKLEIQDSIEKIRETNVIQEAFGTLAEPVIHRLISQADNINKQLEDRIDVQLHVSHSISAGNAREQQPRGSIAKIHDSEKELSNMLTGKNFELYERKSVGKIASSEFKNASNVLESEKNRLKEKQIQIEKNTNAIQEAIGASAESVIHRRISQADNVYNQLKDRIDVQPHAVSAEFAREQQYRECLTKMHDSEKSSSRFLNDEKKSLSEVVCNLEDKFSSDEGSRDMLTGKNIELDERKSSEKIIASEFKSVTNVLESEKNRLKEKQIAIKSKVVSTSELCLQLKRDLEQTKRQLEVMTSKCNEYEKELLEKSELIKRTDDLLQTSQDRVLKLEAIVEGKEITIDNLNDLDKANLQLELKCMDYEKEIRKMSEVKEQANQLWHNCEEQKVEITKLQNLLRDNEIEIEDLKKENYKLDVANTFLTKEINELKRDGLEDKQMSNDFRELRNELEHTKVKLQNMTSNSVLYEKKLQETSEVKKQADEILQNCNEQNSKILELNALLMENKIQIEDLENKNWELFNVNKDLTEEIDQLERNKFEEEQLALTTDANSSNYLCEQLKNDLKQTKQQLNEMNSKCKIYEENMQTEIKEKTYDLLQSVEQNSRITELQEKIRDNVMEIEYLKKEKDTLVNLNENLKKEVDNLKRSRQEDDISLKMDSVSLDDLNSELKSDLEQTKIQLESKTSMCENYEQELEETSQIKRKAAQLRQKSIQRKDGILELQRLLRENQMKVEELKNGNEELNNVNKTLKIKKEELIKENNNLNEEKNSLAEKLDYTNKKVNELKTKASSMENIIKDLENEKEVLKRENELAQGDLASTTSISEQLKTDLKRTQETLKKLEVMCTNYEKELKESLDTKDNFIQKMQSLKSKLVYNKSKLNDIQKVQALSKILSSKDNIDNKENEMLSMSRRSIFRNKDKEMDELCENIILENDGLTERIEVLVKKLNESEVALQQSRATEQIYKNEIDMIQEKLQRRDSSLKLAKEQIKLAEAQIQAFEADSHQNLTDLKNQVKSLEDEVANHKMEKDQIKQQSTVAGERQQQIARSVKSQLDIRERELADLKKEREQTAEQIQDLQIKHQYELSEIKNQIKNEEIEFADLMKQRILLQAKVDEMQILIEDREKSIANFQSQVEALQEKNNILQNQISQERFHSKEKDDNITNLHEKVFNLQLEINNIVKERAEESFGSNGSVLRRDKSSILDHIDNVFEGSTALQVTTNVGSDTERLNTSLSSHSISPINLHTSDEKLHLTDSNIVRATHSVSSISLAEVDNSNLQKSCDKTDSLSDQLIKKNKTLKARLAMSEKRIELLEKEKSDLRSHVLAQVSGKKSISKISDSEKLDLQSQLERKSAFIDELKSELHKTSNLLVNKEKEISDLKKKISEIQENVSKPTAADNSVKSSVLQTESLEKSSNSELVDQISSLSKENFEHKRSILELKTMQKFEAPLRNTASLPEPLRNQYSYLDSETALKLDYKAVESLTQHKWNLIKRIFVLQRDYYKKKSLDVDRFQKFVMYIENQYSSQVLNSLIKSNSEPVLKSTMHAVTSAEIHDFNAHNILISLELDVECLQNFKSFLENSVLPSAISDIKSATKIYKDQILKDETAKYLKKIAELEMHIKQLRNENDILQMENKKFLQSILIPSAESTEKLRAEKDANKSRDRNFHQSTLIPSAETIEKLRSEKDVSKSRDRNFYQSIFIPSIENFEKLRVASLKSASLTIVKSEEAALNLCHKISYIEEAFKSLELDLKMNEHFSQAEIQGDESYGESVKRSLVSQLVQETRALQQRADKVFSVNTSLKAIYDLDTKNQELLKPDVSDKESVLSDDTLTISRSESLSPVSFEDTCPLTGNIMERRLSTEVKYPKTGDEKITDDSKIDKQHSSYKIGHSDAIGSSQDSVCHRSHYSSPDLGIESDPNHESSAPEQAEKDTYARRSKDSPPVGVEMKYSFIQRHQRGPFAMTEKAKKTKDVGGGLGDTLHAIGVLQEYELLKKEIQECLAGIKSILTRTADGLHHVGKYASPRKSLEQTTFKAIRDTSCNIEVCLTAAEKLIDNFHVTPYPTEEEWNLLIQKNQELNNSLANLKSEMVKQDSEFKDAMKKLQHAQLIKENMERKISKKLMKTKKVLQLAKLQLQEPNLHKCYNCNPSLQPKDSAGPSAYHDKGSACN